MAGEGTPADETASVAPDSPPARPDPAPAGVAAGPDGSTAGGAAQTSAEMLRQIFQSEIVRELGVLHLHIDASSGGNTFTAPVEVRGDVVAGGKGKGGSVETSGARTTLGRVSKELLLKILDVHIAATGYLRAATILAGQRLVVLHGPPGMGKRTAALHLLMAGEIRRVLEIGPNLDLRELLGFDFERAGYLVDALVPGRLERVAAADLERLGKQLRDAGAHLILTVNNPRRVVAERLQAGVSDSVVEWLELPETGPALERHLTWYLAGDAPTYEPATICDDELVMARLAAVRSASEVDRIARVLVRWARGEMDRDDARRNLPVQAAHEVEEWFRQADLDLGDRARLLAVAALNGANLRVMSTAADDLHDAMLRQEQGPEAGHPRSIFGATLQQRYEKVDAVVVSGYEETHFGVSLVDTVQFKNESWQAAVLRHVWREYDLSRGCVAAWLRDLGGHPRFDVRVRTAATVGELAGIDFGFVCDEIVQPWANDVNEAARGSAADALSVAAHGEAASLVLNLLSHWSSIQNRRLQWTAAAAFGGPAGLRFPNVALDRLAASLRGLAANGLDELAARPDDVRVVDVVGNSVRLLFEWGREEPAYYRVVLQTLLRWTGTPPPSAVAVIAVSFFLNIALRGRTRGDGSGGREGPTVLLLRSNDAAWQRALKLWARAFLTPSTRDAAMEVLAAWIARADEGLELEDELKGGLVAIVRALPDYDRERLPGVLARIVRGDSGSSPAVERVLGALSEGG
jgi:hypothetical protein